LLKISKFHYLTIAAYSTSTWKKADSAVANFEKFKAETKTKFTWPLTDEAVIEFCKWAGTKNYFSPNTTRAYISTFKFIHKLNNWNTDVCENFLAKSLIRGAENINSPITKQRHRLAMTLPLLKLLGHHISKQNWSNKNKQVIWTASCTAFFGTLRMGEILVLDSNNFDPRFTLTWQDVKSYKECWILHIKSPKSRKIGGEFVNIFKFEGQNCCPFSAISTLKKMSEFEVSNNLPVFRLDNGKYLTKPVFNETISNLLAHLTGISEKTVSGHSFRAGIPSILGKTLPANNEISKEWGRWKSQSCMLYARSHYDARRNCFKNICAHLNSSNKLV